MALVARANLPCLPLLVTYDDSGGHATGQDGAGASAWDPLVQGWEAELHGACLENLHEEAGVGPLFSMDS